MPLPSHRHRPHSQFGMWPPLGFRIWFGFILALILCAWVAAGYVAYSALTDPEGAGRFVGRIVGGAVNGAREATR